MNILVGSTGFVGSNLYDSGRFDRGFHSSDIEDAYGLRPDLLVYAGVRAEKYLANSDPEGDRLYICQAKKNIERIQPGRIVLISTIDVFSIPRGVDETSAVEQQGLHPYGAHRHELEQWVRVYDPKASVVRLPGLFGRNIKKNFIYDFITRIPSVLEKEKMDELSAKAPQIREYYQLRDERFYKVRTLKCGERERLKNLFMELKFTALNFTDSRSVYQFYPLYRLWDDIGILLDHDIRLWHAATEPMAAGELYRCLTGEEFVNQLPGQPAFYDSRTVYGELFGRTDGYIIDKEMVLADIKRFTGRWSR